MSCLCSWFKILCPCVTIRNNYLLICFLFEAKLLWSFFSNKINLFDVKRLYFSLYFNFASTNYWTVDIFLSSTHPSFHSPWTDRIRCERSESTMLLRGFDAVSLAKCTLIFYVSSAERTHLNFLIKVINLCVPTKAVRQLIKIPRVNLKFSQVCIRAEVLVNMCDTINWI